MHRKDEELIVDYQQHDDKSALAELFDRYKNAILNFALRMLCNRADAEDITSDVFLKLFSKRYIVIEGIKFSTWLYKIARNACIDKIRKRKKMISMWFTKNETEQFQEWDVEDKRPLAPEELIKKETTQKVRQAIYALPVELREALLLREYQALSYEEISRVCGCSLENVKVRIFRAREHLRGDLASVLTEENNG